MHLDCGFDDRTRGLVVRNVGEHHEDQEQIASPWKARRFLRRCSRTVLFLPTSDPQLWQKPKAPVRPRSPCDPVSPVTSVSVDSDSSARFVVYSLGANGKDDGGNVDIWAMVGRRISAGGRRRSASEVSEARLKPGPTCRSFDEAFEQCPELAGAIEILRMPLHPEDEALRWVLDRFDHSVRCRRSRDQTGPQRPRGAW